MTATIFLSACADIPSDSVTASRSEAERKACAKELADGDLEGAQVECLRLLDVLEAGFGEG